MSGHELQNFALMVSEVCVTDIDSNLVNSVLFCFGQACSFGNNKQILHVQQYHPFLTVKLELSACSSLIMFVFVSRYTSESSVSLNRSPGQPSSYRSDEELMGALDGPRGAGLDG